MSPKKFTRPEPSTEREAKTCIAVGYGWFYVNRKTIYMLKKAPVYVAAIAAVWASFSYFTTSKSEFHPPESSNGILSSTAYAGDQAVVFDTMLVLNRIQGTDRIQISHKLFPNERPVEITAEALPKVDEYYAEKFGTTK